MIQTLILKAAEVGMTPVILPKKNRKQLRDYDGYLYKLHHLVENAFLLLNRWRGIATRYAKMFLRLLLLSRFVALLFGLLFIDDTI